MTLLQPSPARHGPPALSDPRDLPAPAEANGPADFPLALCSVSKRWSSTGAPVLDALELQLEPGTLTWIGGRNGAGKTTMLRVAAGLIEPDGGTASVWGLTAARHRARYQQLVSFLPAGDRGLYARLTVRRQLEFWARISMVPARRVDVVVEHAIADFALAELAAHRVDRMSMGQRQRLRLAMTFMTEPQVVLLDEPLTSLDAEAASILVRAVQRVRGEGGVVLWCSPTGEQPALSLDAAWVLDRGKLSPA